MKNEKMLLIILLIITMSTSVISCGVSSPGKADEMTETESVSQETVNELESTEEVSSTESDNSVFPDYDLFYRYLTEQGSSIFSDYDGSEICIIREQYDADNLVAFPDMQDIYYWKSTDESDTVETAAEKLVAIMLDSINEVPEEYRLFTLTDYNIYPAVCYSSQTVNEVIQEMKLPENVWIFSPEYTFDYVGRTFFAEREQCEQKGYIAEDGLVKNLRQGMLENTYYVIMKQDNVWRMEKLLVMLLNCEKAAE